MHSTWPACSLTWKQLILQDAWLWYKSPSSGWLHKCLLPQRKKKTTPCHLLRDAIFGDMAIDRDTWLLRTNVLRDLNSCLTAGGLITSSKRNYTGTSVLFLDLGWKTNNNKKKHIQHYLNWDNFLGIDLDWSQSSLPEALLKCQLKEKKKQQSLFIFFVTSCTSIA